MTISTDRVEDESGRKYIVFYVGEPHSEEWIDITAEDVVVPLEKR